MADVMIEVFFYIIDYLESYNKTCGKRGKNETRSYESENNGTGNK